MGMRPETLSDGYASVQVKRIGGAESGEYGLVFRQHRDGYYVFRARNDKHFALHVWREDAATPIIDWTATTAIRPGQPNWLTVIAKGSKFSLYINDRFVAQASDSTFEEGRAGLIIRLQAGDAVIFEFDNFEVREP